MISTTAFRGRDATIGEVSAHLNASYVLSGGYRVAGTQLILAVELAEALALVEAGGACVGGVHLEVHCFAPEAGGLGAGLHHEGGLRAHRGRDSHGAG